MSDNLEELDRAYEEESYDYLWRVHPEIAKAVELGVKRGETAEVIKRRALNNGGLHREALAQRCELAAKYLERSK